MSVSPPPTHRNANPMRTRAWRTLLRAGGAAELVRVLLGALTSGVLCSFSQSRGRSGGLVLFFSLCVPKSCLSFERGRLLGTVANRGSSGELNTSTRCAGLWQEKEKQLVIGHSLSFRGPRALFSPLPQLSPPASQGGSVFTEAESLSRWGHR